MEQKKSRRKEENGKKNEIEWKGGKEKRKDRINIKQEKEMRKTQTIMEKQTETEEGREIDTDNK